MRTSHFKRIAFAFAIQVIFMLVLDTWGRDDWGWPERSCFFGAYVVPFVAYIVFLYDAPMFTRMSSVVRMVCLTLMSYGMTMIGTMVILVLWVAVSTIAGVPVRR